MSVLGAVPAPAVALRAVERRYPNGLQALAGVSLDVEAGGFVSLLGPSGCGKSTLLRLIAGLDRPSAGSVQRAGVEVAAPVPETGMVFQEPTLMPWASVLANVELPLRLAGQGASARREQALAALRAVGLEGFARAVPRELSGGMRMRVSLARALVTQPAVLLLDEPFAALDEITRFRLNDDLLRLWAARRGHGAADEGAGGDTRASGERPLTTLFVTHSVFEAVYLSQRVHVMAARPGRIVDTVEVPEPYPRHASFRGSALFMQCCGALTAALERASAGPGESLDGAARP